MKKTVLLFSGSLLIGAGLLFFFLGYFGPITFAGGGGGGGSGGCSPSIFEFSAPASGNGVVSLSFNAKIGERCFSAGSQRYQVIWDWGDGSTTAYDIIMDAGYTYLIGRSHAFETRGSAYTVTLSVKRYADYVTGWLSKTVTIVCPSRGGSQGDWENRKAIENYLAAINTSRYADCKYIAVLRCESGGGQSATGQSAYGGDWNAYNGTHRGIFQFDQTTWTDTISRFLGSSYSSKDICPSPVATDNSVKTSNADLTPDRAIWHPWRQADSFNWWIANQGATSKWACWSMVSC